MINLKTIRIQFLLDYCEYVSQKQKTWEEFYNICANLLVQLEFLCSDTFNSNIQGYLYTWKLQNVIKTGPIDKKDIFNANGLVGKVVIETSIITALLVWRDLPKYHCQIKINKESNKMLETFI